MLRPSTGWTHTRAGAVGEPGGAVVAHDGPEGSERFPAASRAWIR
jgi:hypothetical protein